MFCQKFIKMGCIASKEDDDTYPNIFKVINVDDFGNQVGSGLLEIKNFDLVLYQKGKSPIMWPLRTLRRYGFDADHFSFESGRRCRTGPGIYAFRCQRAEQLFNLLQSRIQIREESGTAMNLRNSISNSISTSLSNRDSLCLDTVSRRTNSRFSSQIGTGRLSSIGSTSGSVGPLSPLSTTSAPMIMDTTQPAIALPDVPSLHQNCHTNQSSYANEEIITAVAQNFEETKIVEIVDEPVTPPVEHVYSNSADLLSPTGLLPKDLCKKLISEAQIVLLEEEEDEEEVTSPEVVDGRVYMNILPGTENPIPEVVTEPIVELDDVNWNKYRADGLGYQEAEDGESVHRNSPNSLAVKSLNYIVLDLEPTGDPPKSPTSPQPFDNRRLSGGYTAIDFKKTVALSHSIHPDFDLDRDSCRKTRHSSNVFPHERHGSSVSD